MDALDLVCPISCELFENPVRAEDGFTYSRASIEAWFKSCNLRRQPVVSPMTRETMGKCLEENKVAAVEVEKWLQRNPDPGASNFSQVAAPIMRWLLTTPSSKCRDPTRVDMRTMLSGTSSIHDLRRIFATMDDLRPILLESLEGWQPPQLVVIGQESSGKSSVLERLAMMPLFPRDTDICTRLPIHVRLRYSQTAEATLEVFNKITKKTEDGPYIIPTSTGSFDVRAKMEEILKSEKRGALSTERTIILTVKSSAVASIDLVDLPGLVALPPENREASRQLVIEHIKANGNFSMFLATVPANAAPNTSAAMELVSAHALQPKTVGVFTMCDEAAKVPRHWEMLLKRLDAQGDTTEDNGGVALKPHGWVAVMNAEVEEERSASSFSRLVLQASDEMKFMQKKMKKQVRQGHAGCSSLVDKVNKLFLDFVAKDWVPKTIEKLGRAITDARVDVALMGYPHFHKIDRKMAGTAAELASAEAKALIKKATPALEQQCCSNLLTKIRADLLAVASGKVEHVPASKATALWAKQHTLMQEKCEEAVVLWAQYWEPAVKAILEKRTTKADGNASALIASPNFELWRFPLFIKKVLGQLSIELDSATTAVHTSIKHCLSAYFAQMSPFVTVSCDFSVSPPKASIVGKHVQLVDNIMLELLKQGSNLFAVLPDTIPAIAESVSVQEWQEACAEKREETLSKVDTLTKAKARIQELVGSP